MKKVFLLVFCCCNLSAMTPLVPGVDMGQHPFKTLIDFLITGKCFTSEDTEQNHASRIRKNGDYGTMTQGVSMRCSVESQKKETTSGQTEDITQ
jgi:hypothetical protein